MSFLLRPEGAEKCALRDLRRSEARPIHSGELAYVQGNTSRHLAWAGSRQSRVEQSRQVLQDGREDNSGTSRLRGTLLSRLSGLTRSYCLSIDAESLIGRQHIVESLLL